MQKLLPVPVSEATVAELVTVAEELRYQTGTQEIPLLGPGAEALLEQLVHVVLSLPEAQML